MNTVDRERGVRHLRRADPVMRRIVDAVGPCGLRPGARGTHFTTLARAIVGQQLSGKAAETIWRRFCELHENPRSIRPDDVLALDDAEIRATGISTAKTASIKDLAQKVVDGDVRLARIGRLPDPDIVDELVRVRGVGRWTAEMFLVFRLGRPDVWPTGDLGIRNAVRRHYGVEDGEGLDRVAEPWRPWRSVASWYLWRSLDVRTL